MRNKLLYRAYERRKIIGESVYVRKGALDLAGAIASLDVPRCGGGHDQYEPGLLP